MQVDTPHDALINPTRLRFSVAGFGALAVLIALPRFAHTTPDSVHYIALVQYFHGDLPRSALETPFAFRWTVPWLAAQVPAVSPATALALVSLVALVLAYGCFGGLLARLGTDAAGWRRGMAVLVVSFPTFNYGSAVLTDSAGFLVLAAGAWALVARRYVLLGILAAAGVWVRESTLLLLPLIGIFVILERDWRGFAAAAVIAGATLASAVATRWWFADLPAYFWIPTWDRFIANMTRPVSWATVLLTLVPVVFFALPGCRHWPGLPRYTRHFILAAAISGLALAGYSVLAAFMSGRFCWPLYLALIPLAATRTGPKRGLDIQRKSV